MKNNFPKILAVETALPRYPVRQSVVKKFVQGYFQSAYPKEIRRLIKVFDHVQVNKRALSAPLKWYREDRSFPERNEKYVQTASDLGAKAVRKCLKHLSKTERAQIKHFIFVSSTGLSTPTIDARLMNRIGLPKNLKRTPIWGLGCLGGVAALSRAFDFLRAERSGTALILTVELCSLTFQNKDLSKSNLVATSLFGDGAAAALVSYPKNKDEKLFPSMIGTASVLWPKSLDVMGWKIVNTGMEVIFSKNIPQLVRTWLKDTIAEFLGSYGLSVSDIAHFIVHPGGAKVLQALSETFRLKSGQLKPSWKVLNDNGNISSCSVLFVLKEILTRAKARRGEYGLISALGPGFSSELILVQWG